MGKFSLILLLSFTSITAWAAQYENLATIRHLAKRFVETKVHANPGEEIKIKVGHLDSRLRLPACSTNLQEFLPPSGHNAQITAVGVRCVDKKTWTIYVPVSVKIYADVVVAAKHLSKNQNLQATDLKILKRNRSILRHGYFNKLNDVVGLVATRNIRAGNALSMRSVAMPSIVHKGQTVLINVSSG